MVARSSKEGGGQLSSPLPLPENQHQEEHPHKRVIVTTETVTVQRTVVTVVNEDEMRLARLGYKQEVKRVFDTFTNFGLAMSMISVVLGIIPLYGYSLRTGGPAVMAWGWLIVGIMSLSHVLSLGEICSAYPTMGALYFWAHKLGGKKWGPFASWLAGWTNLLGQIAGVASGGYAGATVISDIIYMTSGHHTSRVEVLTLFAMMLLVAGFVNTFTETLLTTLCYFSVGWHLIGVVIVVIVTLATASSLAPASFVFGEFHNDSGFESAPYVCLVGILAAASTFTGYDTAAHVAEETHDSHVSTPRAMVAPMVMALVLGEFLILGMNAAITDLPALLSENQVLEPYTVIWTQTAGHKTAIALNIFVLVAIECSNCANLTSASRMVYSFSRDQALPGHRHWYHLSKDYGGGPVRAIWLCVLISFILGLPGLVNDAVLAALFSLTATGLYASYIIPIFLRITVARDTFVPAEFSLGRWSHVCGTIACTWIAFIVIILCLPEQGPVTLENMNYSPITLGCVLAVALVWWFCGAHGWFHGPKPLVMVVDDDEAGATELGSEPGGGVQLIMVNHPHNGTTGAGGEGQPDELISRERKR